MGSTPTTNRVRKSKSGRPIGFEPLDARIALSASGFHTVALAIDRPLEVQDVAVDHGRGTFDTREHLASPPVSPQFAPHGDRDSAGQQLQTLAEASSWNGNVPYRQDIVLQRVVPETRILPASVQVAGSDVYVPGVLIARGNSLTLVIDASPLVTTSVWSLPDGLAGLGQNGARPPLAGDRGWASRPSVEAIGQQFTTLGDRGPAADGEQHLAPSTPHASAPSASGATASGDLRNVVMATPQPSVDPRLGGVWVAEAKTAERSGEAPRAPVQVLPHTGQWAIAKTDLDEGLIELESPLAPRRKGRKSPGDAGEEEQALPDSWRDVQTLAQHLWSAWQEAWQQLGMEPGHEKAADDVSEQVARTSQGNFNQDVLDGLVELVVEEAVADAITLPAAGEQLAEGTAPLRIEGGIAIHQQFEVATAADAQPPAETAKAEREDAQQERADAQKPAAEQRVSAAAVGAAMVIAVPFSLRKRHEEDERAAPPRLGPR